MFFTGRYAADTANATLDLVRGEGMARAGYAAEAPLAYADAARGLTGEAPEIARAVLQRMGVQSRRGSV
jgi:polar amino acid transport system substrate-binding protein